MSDVAIAVESLGKRYRIGTGPAEPYGNLRESMMRALGSPLRRLRGMDRDESAASDVWALKDISFEVKHGEAVGIIGRNGAGKSTLLKVLSRITAPTAGRAVVHGRVGSLLEVGTGFHPELTGRENIYLNGAVMGMSRADLRRQFDEIVDFSGVEKYLDTPVKRYSSGMYMRLAFAVAAHLEPEVLVVDEVLAVGDAAFQKKCLGKMDEVVQEGRTVLFVSHSMGAVGQLCQTGIILDRGRELFHGTVSSAIQQYLASSSESCVNRREYLPNPSKPVQVLEVYTADARGMMRDRFDIADPVHVHIRYRVSHGVRGANLAMVLSRNGTDVLCSFDTDAHPELLEQRPAGTHVYTAELPPRLLKAGLYTVTLSPGLINVQAFETLRDAITFEVEELSEDTSFRGYNDKRPGVLIAPVIWRHRYDA
jgi:lipopolysaccharide transport system ATP-binding protein